MKKNSRKLFKKYENNIVDIFLFGSYIKNKSKPEDIDICIVLKDSDYNLPEKIYPDFKKLFDGAHYNWILINELFEISLFSTLIEEGYSLLNDYYLSEKLGYTSKILFAFDLKNLNPSKKVLFSYALHGKNGAEGILKKVRGEEFSRAAIFVPMQASEEFREFLEQWKANYKAKKVMVG